MSKFKIGDKVVVREDCDKSGFPRGTVVVVEKLLGDDQFGSPIGIHSSEFWDLKESELRRLVRVANEGQEAKDNLLLKYAEQVKWTDGKPLIPETTEINARLMIKPTFEPFYVGPLSCTTPHSYCGQVRPDCVLEGQWLVSINDNFLSINFGARTYGFKAYDLMCALSDLTKNSTEFAVVSNWKLGCMREGICVDGRWQISWSDADRILAELEKAEVANV